MAENTKIEWCDHTFNPWEGCTKVGPGCDNCYAEIRNARFAGGIATNWGPGAPRRRTSAANWRKPLAWNAAHAEFFAQHGRRQRVFCASLADVFDNEVAPAWRCDLFDLIEMTPNLDWLLLTKRIGNVVRMLPSHDWAMRGNVWIGITVVNQAEADRDIPKLLAVTARVRFLSMEPLLGPVDLEAACERAGVDSGSTWATSADAGRMARAVRYGDASRIDWAIVGGESGPGARPMHPDWPRSLRDQCAAAGVPFLFKQWGEWAPSDACEAASGDAMFDLLKAGKYCVVGQKGDAAPCDAATVSQPSEVMYRVGKKAAGRLLDGHTLDGFPGATHG